MSLPTAYLTTTKKLSDIFDAIKTAKAPEKFTQKFLETLEFKGKGDRLIINVLKALNFIDDAGKPTNRYYEFLDQSQSAVILAEGIKEAYSDLFSVNINANTLTKQEIIGKLKTLTQGKYSDGVINCMANTFISLSSLADFETKKANQNVINNSIPLQDNIPKENTSDNKKSFLNLSGLVYNIQIILPETRDSKVYDALFKSLKEHLL